MRIWLGTSLWLGRRYDEAIEQARILLELDPTGCASHHAAGQFYGAKGMMDEAVAAHTRAAELSGGAPWVLGWLGLALAQSGKLSEARALLEHLHQIGQSAYVPPTSFAWVHLGMGETDDAFTWLERAVDGRDPMIMPVKTFPFLDPLRSDSRYLALLRKMNLEP